jgi:radical SAM protein with 4Fe4S-binding SPASM domain
VDLRPLEDNRLAGNLSLPCLAHSLSTVIGAEGNVWLCGRLNTGKTIRPMGNLVTETFSSIWEGQERAAQAKMVGSGEFCGAHCPRCRMTKYNRLLFQVGALGTPDFI